MSLFFVVMQGLISRHYWGFSDMHALYDVYVHVCDVRVHVCDVYVHVCDVYVHVQLVQMEARISLPETMYTHHPLAVDTTPVR